MKRAKFGVSRHFGRALWIFSSLWWPFGWNWSYLGFLDIIWRTCGSKCRGEGGGIFPTLCIECCLVAIFFLEIMCCHLPLIHNICFLFRAKYPWKGRFFFKMLGICLLPILRISHRIQVNKSHECIMNYWKKQMKERETKQIKWKHRYDHTLYYLLYIPSFPWYFRCFHQASLL